MSRYRSLPLSILVLGMTFSATSAALAAEGTLIGQDRRVSGNTFVTTPADFDTDHQEFTATDGGPFDAAALTSALVTGSSASTTATQSSTVTPRAVFATGAFDASAQVNVAGGTAYAAAQSNVALRFTVPEATTYELQGYVEAVNGGFVSIGFSRPFLTVEFFSTTDQHLDLDESGLIDAGTYDLNITASTSANADVGVLVHTSGAYDLQLILGSATAVIPAAASSRLVAAPNPFFGQTRLVLPESARAVRIVDLAGHVVRTLTGTGSLTWDGTDEAGRDLAAGVYWVRPVGTTDAPIKVVRVR